MARRRPVRSDCGGCRAALRCPFAKCGRNAQCGGHVLFAESPAGRSLPLRVHPGTLNTQSAASPSRTHAHTNKSEGYRNTEQSNMKAAVTTEPGRGNAVDMISNWSRINAELSSLFVTSCCIIPCIQRPLSCILPRSIKQTLADSST